MSRSEGGVSGAAGRHDADWSARPGRLPARFRSDDSTLYYAVYRRTRDDLEHIVRGRRDSTIGRLWDRIRGSVLVLLAVVAVASLLWMQMETLFAGAGSVEAEHGDGDWLEIVSDPVLVRAPRFATLPVRSERKVVDHLLAQIDSALGKKAGRDPSNTGYLLVPASKPGRFWLLRHALETDAGEDLSVYRRLLSPDYPLSPSLFLFSSLPESQRKQWLEMEGVETTSGDYPEVTEADLVDWVGWISWTWGESDLAASLARLSGELGFHLHSPASDEQEPQTAEKAPPHADNVSPATGRPALAEATTSPDAGARKPKTGLVSELILDAFAAADPRLAFDLPRLWRFREVLRVYRRLLDGEVISRPQATPNGVLPGLVSLSVRLTDLHDPKVLVFWSAVAGILLLIFVGPVWRALSSLVWALVNRRRL